MRLQFNAVANGEGRCSATCIGVLRMKALPAPVRQAVWLLGLCQCVLWGVLYYSFSVLLVPVATTLGVSQPVVAGAYSLGLGAMALAAPSVGRLLDLGHGRSLTWTASAMAVVGLAAMAVAVAPITLYVAWLLIGAAMAGLLYEPAFVLVTRAVPDEAQRLHALAAVTVLGGLASTLFLPALAWLIGHWHWRAAVAACAAAVVAVAWVMDQYILYRLPPVSEPAFRPAVPEAAWPPHLWTLTLVFAGGTWASMALITVLIPLLIERGASPADAASVLAALGISQLPGRVWLLRRRVPEHGLGVLPILLQGTGLVGLLVAPGLGWCALAVAAFGAGAGLQTLARPWWIQRLYGPQDAGRWNGEVARVQGMVRAAGPVVASTLALRSSGALALTLTAGLVFLTLPLVRRLPQSALPSQ